MSNQTEIIKNTRNILIKVKKELFDNEGNINRQLFRDALSAFSVVKEHRLTDLAKEVYDLLESPEPIIRQDAIATLGFTTRLHMPEFREKAYEIFLNDPDDSVKSTALTAWASYYFESNNKKVLKILYDILLDDKQSCFVRSDAYCGIYTTISDLFISRNSINTTPLINSETAEEFNRHINWQELEEIMRKYPPEVLNESGARK